MKDPKDPRLPLRTETAMLQESRQFVDVPCSLVSLDACVYCVHCAKRVVHGCRPRESAYGL
jgi:hypothetical protein